MKVPARYFLLGLTLVATAAAHDPGSDEAHPHYDWSVTPPQVVLVGTTAPDRKTTAAEPAKAANRPAQAAVFEAFAPKVSVRWDEKFLYVESDGLPAHKMMVGITAWQQQVPLPQSYKGANAWRFPLHPVPAREAASIKGRFLRGAVALAANGIPIFNPQNNRGEISKEIGELDQWGGHCGRADDYHYHVAPLHLQSVVGKGRPLAYALDGYPILGLEEPDGSAPDGLDACRGHTTKELGYHYHASLQYPYVNGGFHGEVAEADGQVDPQPRAQPVRQAGAPLRGARITSFESHGNTSTLGYEVGGDKRSIAYTVNAAGTVAFEFRNSSGGIDRQSYGHRQGGREAGGQAPPPRAGGPPGPGGRPRQGTPDNPPVRNGPRAGGGGNQGLVKPTMADTVKVNVYADNWFVLYVNGKLRAVDPIEFTPHNVVSLDILPEYPMTIAILAKDNADPKTGLEYGDHIGDGGFIIKFSDGTVSNATWKAKSFFTGPLNGDVKNPAVEHTPLPERWWAADFDDTKWPSATEFTEQQVNPKEPFYQADFSGAKFIWSNRLDLHNTVIFRTKVEKPGWSKRWTTTPDLDIREAPAR